MSNADAGGRSRSQEEAAAAPPASEDGRWQARAVFCILAGTCVSGVAWIVERVLPGAHPGGQVFLQISLDTLVIFLLLGVARRQEARRTKNEQALRRKEQELAFIADHLPAQIAFIDRELRYRFVNAPAARAVESTPEKIIGRTVAEVIGPERLQARLEGIQRALAGERVEFEAQVVSPGTEQRFGSVTYVPFRAPGGNVEGLIGLVIDITARKHAEAEARELAARLTATLDSLTTAFITVDREWRLTFLNRAAERVVGKRREDVLGQEAFATFPNVVGTLFHEQYELSMRENRPVSFTAYYAPHEEWYEVNTFPSEQGLALYFQNVTARKKAEEALRQSEAGMALAQRVAKFGSWEMELTEGSMSPDHPVRWSDEAFKIAGRLPQSFQPTLGDFMRAVHPDDVARVTEAWADAVAHRTHYLVDHRIILPDGQVRIVHEEAQIFERTGTGGPPIAVGTVRDITEQAYAEEALRASEERFRAVFEQAPIGICELDAAGRFLRVNRQFWEMLGYTEEELLKLGVAEVTHPEQRPLCLRLIGEIVAGVRQTYDLEKRFLPRGGGILWAHLTLTALQPSQGQPRSVMALVEDITARKLEEETRRLKAAILDSTGEAAIATRMDGTLIYLNRAAEVLFGWDRVEALGAHVLALTRAEVPREQVEEIMSRIARGESWTGEFIVRSGQGGHFPVEATISPLLDESGQAAAIIAVATDISERKRAQAALQRSEEQLRALSARLERLREEDRTRIAREIHDELGQTLTGLMMDLRWLESHVEEWAAPRRAEALDRIVEARRVVGETMKAVQSIAADLRPGVLDKLGLAAALEYEARRFVERMGVPCLVCRSESLPELSPEVTTALFRIFQECLTNVARHAAATQVWVHLCTGEGEIGLKVEDNGRGLNESEVERSTSLGLLGIRERVAMLGGSVSFALREGGGTVVTVRVPTGTPTTPPLNPPTHEGVDRR
jgi:PAS domain S-box-containing protein